MFHSHIAQLAILLFYNTLREQNSIEKLGWNPKGTKRADQEQAGEEQYIET